MLHVSRARTSPTAGLARAQGAERYLGLLLVALLFVSTAADRRPAAATGRTAVDVQAKLWVDSVLADLDTAQRLGQLIVARAHPDGSRGTLAEFTALVDAAAVGGVCFFGSSPQQLADWTAALRADTVRLPLLFALDAEWGPAMRIGSELSGRLPYALTQGAANDPALTRELGQEAGRQLRLLGIDMSLGPVADLNSNPDNPVIGRRSFGEQPIRAGRLAQAFARGLADAGVLAVAKHFPGHGAPSIDSHEGLPTLDATRAQLDSTDLVPFRLLAQDGIAGIMTGHLAVPALDPRVGVPASLSPGITEGILRNEYKYEGLVVSDGLDMAAVQDSTLAPGEVSVRAFLAGNDVLLLPPDPLAAHQALLQAMRAGRFDGYRLESSVRRVLLAKYAALQRRLPEEQLSGTVASRLGDFKLRSLNERLYRAAVTPARLRTAQLPLGEVGTVRTAVLSIGSPAGEPSPFQSTAELHQPLSMLHLGKPLDRLEVERWTEQLSSYDRVLVGLHGLSSDGDYGLVASHLRVLRAAALKTEVIVVVFGSPYALRRLAGLPNVLVAYEDTPMAQRAAAEVIYGSTRARGTLPVSVPGGFRAGRAAPTGGTTFRLRLSTAANAGMSELKLNRLESIVEEAMRTQATPGGVLLAARDGEIGAFRSYGKFTYEDEALPVDLNTVYDLASVTKVAATTLAIMKLHEQRRISVYDSLGRYVVRLRGTNKGSLVIADILAHEARLRPWIPFYESTILTDKEGARSYRPDVYAPQRGGPYGTSVTDRLFIADAYRDTVYNQIYRSELRSQTGYRYSDLGFYLMAVLVEEMTGQTLDEYVYQEFYRPLGLRTIGFNPLERLSLERIPPTEDDDYFRFGRVQGYVHDMGAAMLGGVSGHAGLFSDAYDLAVIMQMLLNEGYYGGRRYFEPATVRLFTRRHPQSTRRGLGWDMAELSRKGGGNMSPLASARTFGHLGFTGTCAWADPETGVVFVWLTNRTFPKMTPNLFGKENYRPRLQGVVYESLR